MIMNILKIVEQMEKTDPAVRDHLSRREMFKNASVFGSKIALASVPLVLSGMFTKATARSKESVTAVLNFALTLEYLEDDFYKMGLAAAGLIPADRKVIFDQISKHEASHVAFLKSAITSLSATPVAKPVFDFTANGTYADVFTNYQTFLALSQAFEDTGVRAYKGRAAELMVDDAVLTAALQIHSVEARHASMIRRLRAEKGWITANTGSPAAVYAGEENVTQGGVDVTTLGYNATVATQAFDEPLSPANVLAIAGQFIVS
jgi:rubrerythrin